MKDFIRFCLSILCGALIIYAAYLVLKEFICPCGKEDDDLKDKEEKISFSERVKKAANRQLEKIS